MINGCLLIHGLTGTPATVWAVQEALLSKGFRVAAPCLAGHGGSVEDLAKTSWQDWYETVRVAFQTIRKEVDKVYFTGLSLGTLLGLKLALDEGWGVRALALMSTPLKLSWLESIAIPVVRHTPFKHIIQQIPKNLQWSVSDPAGRELYDQLSLPSLPLNAVFEIAKLQKELTKHLHRISNPILLLHSRQDKIAPYSNVDLIKKSVSSDIVETLSLSRSYHVISMDVEKTLVTSSIVDFFKRFA